KEVIDNWMYANSIHMIDYFSMFCRGKLTKVTPIVLWNKNNPKYVASKLQFDSGDIGLYECFWNSPAPWSVSINTENIRLDMTPLESLTKQVYESRKKNNIELDKVDYDFKPGIRLQAELLIKTIKNNKAYLPTLDQAIDTMKIINLIYFKN
ncbi:MAG: gfo/Idh/MocA family oxidoreductase, partial [Flavobacteriaceae bacterium]|nr:gfo/Idh/MocA family oxidoreductase [Flavobacteriaceae bacterium]